MNVNYFVYNNIRYYSGTIVKLKHNNSTAKNFMECNATFMYVNRNLNRIVVKINDCTYQYPYEDFQKRIIGITKYVNISDATEICPQKRKCTFADEINIDGLLIAWMWYICIMAVATIFYDRIGIWILTSVIFFHYRNKKLKEAGYK